MVKIIKMMLQKRPLLRFQILIRSTTLFVFFSTTAGTGIVSTNSWSRGEGYHVVGPVDFIPEAIHSGRGFVREFL